MLPRNLSPEEIKILKSLGSPKLDALIDWTYSNFSCSHCGKCTRRCEVLSGPDLDMGKVQDAFEKIMALPEDAQVEATLELMSDDYLLYNALRQCCFCGHCTAPCRRHVLAPEVMRAWRELFMKANLMPPDASKLVMVDNEWNIFSAYRAIYQISYPDVMMLDAAAEAGPGEVDTLFFPGCSLVSYAPELVGVVCDWLKGCGIRFAMSDGCCGSPLMSAGLFDRARDLRNRFISQMRSAGIRQIITICPGCADEFRLDLPADIELVPLPEVLLEHSEARRLRMADTGFNPMQLGDITFFDSCHDRDDMRNAIAIRSLFALNLPSSKQLEMRHNKRDSLCCGAGGAVASYDPTITDARTWRVVGDARETGAQTMITMCPTCTYTFAQANLTDPCRAMDNLNYLEALFGTKIDWTQVFANLNGMWTGEYGPWLNATFF